MKIVTVNLPEYQIEEIKGLVGENGIFPSRSELIRVAIRDFLITEITMSRHLKRNKKEEEIKIVFVSDDIPNDVYNHAVENGRNWVGGAQ